MIRTDGRPTIAVRTEPIDPRVKDAHRLKTLAPLLYRKRVKEGRLPQV